MTAYRPSMGRAGLASSVFGAVVLVLAFASGAASGRELGVSISATTFKPCASLTGVMCARVPVALDPSRATPGSLTLFVAQRPAFASRGTILLLAGGPGEASAQIFSLRSRLWRTLFPGYTVAAYDNRGTGDSQALSCHGARGAAACAKAIGNLRVFYGTRENVEDIEAVRRVLGVDRIALLGLSYGTKQALAYARAYPDRVERLVLDSVVLPDGPDPLGLPSLAVLPSALASICHGGACEGVTHDAAGELAVLANRLEARPLIARVSVYTSQWAPSSRRVRIDGRQLLALATASDLNTGVAVTLPAAVHAALAGRPALLERLAALVAQQDDSSVNDAVHFATTCNDGPFPWKPEMPVGERPRVLAEAVSALPQRSLGSLGRWAAAGGSADECLDWPAPAGVEATGGGRMPDVPVLVLAGDRDVRTPVAAGRTAAALFPHGRLLVAPGVGHTVIGLSPCVDNAVRTWIRGGDLPTRCPRVASTIRPAPLLPASVAVTTPLGASRDLVGRTLGATVATLRHAEAAWLTNYPSGWVVGLHGGLLDGEYFDVFRYSAYSDIPGLAVSGRLGFAGSKSGTLIPGSESGIVQVGGRNAAPGFLQVGRHRIFGLLGGRHVVARF